MKQRKWIYSLFAGLIMTAMFISCNSGNKVVSSFGKRKYTKGFYFNSYASSKITTKPINLIPGNYHTQVSQMDTSSGNKVSIQTIAKDGKYPLGVIEKKSSSISLTKNRILPKVLALKDMLSKNNPVVSMPADTNSSDNNPTDYRKYNREAIGGLILGLASLGLMWTGFGLLLAIPGFFLSLWGQDSQKLHTLAVIGVIANSIALLALIVFLLVELIVIVNGGS